jgi:hypothetical protein
VGRAPVVGQARPGTRVASGVIVPFELLEPFHGFSTQQERVLGDAHLTGAPKLRTPAVERVDELAKREHEAGSLEVWC